MSKKEIPSTSSANGNHMSILMEKLQKKKGILEQAKAILNKRSVEEEKLKEELTKLKLELFKLGALVKETEIRVRIYEKKEKELRNGGEKATKTVKDNEDLRKKEQQMKEDNNKQFALKLVKILDEFHQFKGEFDRKSVAIELEEMNNNFTVITNEIGIMNLVEGSGIDEKMGDDLFDTPVLKLVTSDESDIEIIKNLRELQEQIDGEIQHVLRFNRKRRTVTSQLEIKKVKLLRTIDSNKKTEDNS